MFTQHNNPRIAPTVIPSMLSLQYMLPSQFNNHLTQELTTSTSAAKHTKCMYV